MTPHAGILIIHHSSWQPVDSGLWLAVQSFFLVNLYKKLKISHLVLAEDHIPSVLDAYNEKCLHMIATKSNEDTAKYEGWYNGGGGRLTRTTAAILDPFTMTTALLAIMQSLHPQL
ncbi:hypothetical protein ACJX0J_034183, partial [Zea mays]